MIITQSGVTIRLPVQDIRMTGRAAQGVKLINLREDDSIASVARVEASDTEIEVSDDTVQTDNESDNEVVE
nr:DNA gyrase C-terminal beta-propeller domain-containing protein [Prolixibacter bellariivorans]